MKAQSKNSVVAKTTTNRKEYHIETDPDMKDPYYDECWSYYLKKGKGSKPILMYQVRMYKSWKHNRKTQWK